MCRVGGGRHLDTPWQAAVSFVPVPGKQWCWDAATQGGPLSASPADGVWGFPAWRSMGEPWGSPGLCLAPALLVSLLLSSEFFLFKKKKSNNTEAKRSFFLPAVMSSDVASGPLPAQTWCPRALQPEGPDMHDYGGKGERRGKVGRWSQHPLSPYCVPSTALSIHFQVEPASHTFRSNINTSIAQRKTLRRAVSATCPKPHCEEAAEAGSEPT